jgi:hypothetical protein
VNVHAITFALSPVPPAVQLLTETDERTLFLFSRTSDFFPDKLELEAGSTLAAPLVSPFPMHGFVHTIHLAFSDHRPLVIAPDHIWLLICQGVARHVAAHHQQVATQFVSHAGKNILSIQRDDFIKGLSDNPWLEVLEAFEGLIKAKINRDLYTLLMPTFSTTGIVEKAVFQIALMDVIQPYFDFQIWSRCGIPSVTLEGTVNDWRDLHRRVQQLTTIGLDWWVDSLMPILEELVRTAAGHINLPFWEHLYKAINRSGGPDMSGWVLRFFPYLIGSSGQADRRNPYLGQDFLADAGKVKCSTSMLPPGMTIVPFEWAFPGARYSMAFAAGFVGTHQNHETGALRPAIDWAVGEGKWAGRK